jgi:hypothetical protein
VFAFPPVLTPPPPFPLVVSCALRTAFVAPGVTRATYRLSTSSGPLVVQLIAVDLGEPSVRLGVTLAADRLVSSGETTSSMAARTGAVAGVNADYFDIGQTNQPLNVVIRDGALIRTPSTRIALEVERDRTVRFTNFRFSGTVAYGATRLPLTTVDEWPPQGGVSILTPAFGTLKPVPGVLLAALTPLGPPGNTFTGSYRVDSIGAPAAMVPSGLLLGFGPAALKLAAPPLAGDTVEIAAALDPPLDGIVAAVGGGPLLVRSANPFEDPHAPAPDERDRRFPVSGAATTPNGDLVLMAVDGRAPSQSIGLTRPEFAALMLGLGASDGMAFDSGGSATLVGRVLGDERASVLNAPSDGSERPIADALFVYSDAPRGVDPHLVLRPGEVAAMSGALVRLTAAIVDDAGHRLRGAEVAPQQLGGTPGTHSLIVHELTGDASAKFDYRIVGRLARLVITVVPADPDPGAVAHVRAFGYDADGTPVLLSAPAWSTSAGTIAPDGTLRAPFDATVSVRAGDAVGSLVVPVGRHAVPLAFPSAGWSFATFPPGGAGSVGAAPASGLQLTYDLSGPTRAAYANGNLTFPGAPLAFAVDVLGDGNGATLRATFVNRFGERRTLTLAKNVDWTGRRRLEIPLPPDLNPPVSLVSLYAVIVAGGAPIARPSSLVFDRAAVVVPGTP